MTREPSRRRSATTRFGTPSRTSHDASSFYARFAPVAEVDTERVSAVEDDVLGVWHGDARDLGRLADHSVALVVTSPPYFAGKEYEADPGNDGSPESWAAHLELLGDTFSSCHRVLEDGGRIAVNVANLGRRPYRDLTGAVCALLEANGFLLRGEIVWVKGKGANNSTAWGSYAKPSNPVLRDVTERIVVASAGRFDRAIHWRTRQSMGLPWEATITPEAFRRDTLDTWEFPPESAKRVGHPAPFPVELPRRLIELYTYRSDVVVDPFCGSGSTGVAAALCGRRFFGVDADASYVAAARERIAETHAAPATATG